MKLYQILAPALIALGLMACTHTPPGTSVNVALAKRPDVVRMPSLPPTHPEVAGHLPIIEPELPGNSTVERVGEAFSRGQFCMQAGKDAEAIAAFQEAVKIDPGFAEAWQHLAILYAKTGDDKKSLEAYRKAKSVAQR